MDLQKFLDKAELALRKRRPEQAVALYRQVLRAAPGDGAARAGLLAAFRRGAELRGGPSLLDRAAARSLRVAAAGLSGAHQFGPLVATCEKGLERDPSDAGLTASLASALEAQGLAEGALAVWEHRLELVPDDVLALREAGRLHHALGRLEPAAALLDRAHALDPRDPAVGKLRKTLAAEGTLASTGFATARSSHELVKDTEVARAAGRQQRLHRTAEERADAVSARQAEVDAAPDDIQALCRLVEALLGAGRLEAAAERVEQGRARWPGDEALARVAAAVTVARAEAAVEQARQGGQAPALEAARKTLARAEIDLFTRALAASPGEGALRLRLARACYRAGETEQAIEHFQALAPEGRYELEARHGLGACFLRQGLLPLARRQLGAALDLAGGVTGDRGKEICYHLGLVCERQGETSEALARYMEIYEVDIHFKDVATRISELS